MPPSRYPQYTWQQTEPGHWEREIDEAERFYTCLAKSYEGSKRMYFAITGFVSISVDTVNGSNGHEVEEALRKAWLKLRYDYPTLASRVSYSIERQRYIKSYTVFDPSNADSQTESWLGQTFVPITPGVSGLDWCNSDPLAPEIPTLFIITPPYASANEQAIVHRDLVFRSPHDTIDGIGTLQLLNKLLKYAARYHAQPAVFDLPLPGSETRNLSPPLRVAAAISPVLTLDQQTTVEATKSRNAELRQTTEILTMPLTRHQALPGKHQRAALALLTSDTARVLQACKTLGATVTHVYHASIALHLRDLQPSRCQERTARYINYCLINERPNCTEPYNTTDHAVSVYHTVSGNSLALDLTIPSAADRLSSDYHTPEQSQTEFQDLVHKVKDFYIMIRNSPDKLALGPSFWSMATPHIPDPESKNSPDRPVPAPNPSPSVSISSMGQLDNIIAPKQGTFTAKDPWVTGEELGTGLGLFLGTWQGKLQLSAAYNEAWHDREEIREFLESCSAIVWRGLGLGSELHSRPDVEWRTGSERYRAEP